MISGPTIRVCLVIEGSYPFVTGGVSAWVHQLILDLEEIEFALFTISPSADQPLNYELPPNVMEHKDLVLSVSPTAKRKSRSKKKLLDQVEQIHSGLLENNAPSLEDLIRMIPAGHSIYKEVVDSDRGWGLLTDRNAIANPVYPFSDYFWAWKSAHDMMFTVLSARLPEADMYHAVSTGYAGLAAAAAKIRQGKPCVLTEHGLYHKEREMEIRRTRFIRGYQRDMWIKIYNNLSRISYRYSDLIIALFEFNRRLQLELGAPENKTRVIPNGIDTSRYSAIVREKRPGFHVGLVGRVVPIKDIKTFIAAAKIVSEKVPEAQFHCIGPTDEDEGYYENCRMLVESLRLTEVFHFTGRQDVRDYYAFIDVLLLTSVREAQPLVILEGYCAGVPVVATRVGNVPELLDYDERFIASPKDAEKLAEGILYIHQHPGEIEELAAANKRKVYQFYDRKAVHQAYREIYRQYTGTMPRRGAGD